MNFPLDHSHLGGPHSPPPLRGYSMSWDTVQQLVRILLQLAAGWLLNQGIITEDHVTTIVGAGVSLGGVIWWILWDRNRPPSPSG